MLSQLPDTGWDFGPVLDLIDSDVRAASPLHSPRPQSSALSQTISTDRTLPMNGVSLGDFGKLFAQLGLSDEGPLPPTRTVEHVFPKDTDESLEPTALDVPTIIDVRANPQRSASPPADYVPFEPEPLSTCPDPATLNKKERRAARKRLKNEIMEAAKQADVQIQDRTTLVMETSSPRYFTRSVAQAEQAAKQMADQPTRAQSRSNVGAKIRPATPVRVPSPTKNRKLLSETEKRIPTTPHIASTPTPLPKADVLKPAGHNKTLSITAVRQETPPVPISKPTPDTATPLSRTNPTPTVQKGQEAIATPVRLQVQAPTLAPPIQGYFTTQAPQVGAYNSGLIPRTVQPAKVQRPVQPVVTSRPARTPATPSRSGSLTILPKVDRNFQFFNKLLAEFPEDMPWLVSPMQLCNDRPSEDGLHIFVDASNIMYGLRDRLRRCNAQQFELSFDSLALLLERRRPVAKRVFAGSHREANPLPHVTRLIETSKAVGYENNVQEQVFITREDSERKKFFKDVERVGWHKATQRRGGGGSGSDSESGPVAASAGAAAGGPSTPSPPPAPKWVEQGVDEILHLKMCQSIIDAESPATMVLATGDGAEAEMSDGFLAHVERALRKGWRVELVSWRSQINGGYKERRFRQKWGDMFRIIELDGWLECLVEGG